MGRLRRILKSTSVPGRLMGSGVDKGDTREDDDASTKANEVEDQVDTRLQGPLATSKPLNCCAPGCQNANPNRTFHRFPVKPDVRAVWEERLGTTVQGTASNDALVCSGHFDKNDFEDCANSQFAKVNNRTYLKEVRMGMIFRVFSALSCNVQATTGRFWLS